MVSRDKDKSLMTKSLILLPKPPQIPQIRINNFMDSIFKRPVFHFTPPSNWMNDPNGLIYFGGKYHMFYQHFPYAPKWGTMHWGHAVSDDMVSWESLPVALFPTKSYDRDGVFSGGAIEKDDKMYLYYTAIKYLEVSDEDTTVALNCQFEASQAMLISDDGYNFDNFEDKKQIIKAITDEKVGDRIHTRDPKVWKFRDKYYMILGSKIMESGNDTYTPRVLFYVSNDAVNWQYINAFGVYGSLGNMWECPDIFPCPENVLVLSPEQMRSEDPTNNSVFGIVGFDNTTCTLNMDTDKFRFIDYGLDYYAPQSFIDKLGNRVQFGWLRMKEPVEDENGVKWIGAMTMPRVVTTEMGKIYTRLHPNLKAAFKTVTSLENLSAPGCLNIELSVNEELKITDSYVIYFDGKNVIADRVGKKYSAPCCGDSASLDIYIDSNIIEIYINDGESVISHVL